jgi:hypothetical protein
MARKSPKSRIIVVSKTAQVQRLCGFFISDKSNLIFFCFKEIIAIFCRLPEPKS